ncbi:MAG: hypothetical protein U0172_02185 [Nitrospiraceae bacterium]
MSKRTRRQRWIQQGMGLAALALLLGGGAAEAANTESSGAAQDRRGTTANSAEDEASLPLSVVKLYTSGVGYFERSGTVNGTRRVTIPATPTQLDDLLKSLVVQDPQGTRAPIVEYASRDPLAKALGGFGLNLTENQSLTELLGQLRGERIRLAAPQDIEGVVVGVETRQEAGGKDVVVPVDYVTLVTDQGFRSVPIPQIQHLSLLNQRLSQEVQQALALLATRHDTQKAPVTVRFDGTNARLVRLAYLLETPLWKTTYRLVLDGDKAPWLQGWALVDNPTDQDWTNVRLSLLSGRPVSFTMHLSEPLYGVRPLVQPELYASIRPQVHDNALEPSRPAALGSAAGAGLADRLSERRMSLSRSKAAADSGEAESQDMAPMSAAPMMEYAAKLNPEQIAAPVAQGQEVGGVFQYEIAEPVTIARHQAAMVPILNAAVGGETLSIFNARTHPKHPMSGVRLRNTSDLHLMQGPITVFNGGSYAGDARLLDLAPKQDRLITFALDLKTEVESRPGIGRQEIQSVALKKGTMLVTRKWIEQVTYVVKNNDRRPVNLLIEHPARPDWSLVEAHPGHERARDLYRLPVKVAAGESATLTVTEQRPVQESVMLSDVGPEYLVTYLQAPQLSAKVKDALQQAAGFRQKVMDAKQQRSAIEQSLKDIEQEQHRLRENMRQLDQRSELYGRYVKKLDAQETEVERLRKSLADTRKSEEDQRRQLQKFLDGLDLS